MPAITGGSDTANQPNVTSTFDLHVALPKGTAAAAPQNAGFATLMVERDSGSYLNSGVRDLSRLRVSANDRMEIGQPVVLFQETFNGTALNTGLFDSTATTFTTAVTGGFVTLNSGSSVATSGVARLLTKQFFSITNENPLYVEWVGQMSQVPQTNNVMEIGKFLSSGITAPTDGFFFRYDATATLKAVVNINGTEITSSAITGYATNATRYAWKAEVIGEEALFYINGVLVATIACPATAGKPFNAESLPAQVRIYNSSGASPALAQQLKIASVAVMLEDAAPFFLDGPHLQALQGRCAYQGQTGHTMGTTALFANSANPTAAVPTNTTAALGSGLGGNFLEIDTLAATTDGIISSYQNPAGTAAISGRTLMITGVKIDSFVQTVLGVGGYNAVWSLAFGHTAVSLATAEAATDKAPRRIALGSQSVASTAPALTQLNTLQMSFASPIPVYPGEFIQTVKKKVGTASASGQIWHNITFDGYFV